MVNGLMEYYRMVKSVGRTSYITLDDTLNLGNVVFPANDDAKPLKVINASSQGNLEIRVLKCQEQPLEPAVIRSEMENLTNKRRYVVIENGNEERTRKYYDGNTLATIRGQLIQYVRDLLERNRKPSRTFRVFRVMSEGIAVLEGERPNLLYARNPDGTKKVTEIYTDPNYTASESKPPNVTKLDQYRTERRGSPLTPKQRPIRKFKARPAPPPQDSLF